MRHKKRGKKLNRNSSHRRAMLRNMAVSLILSLQPDAVDKNSMICGRIFTTVQKAKYLRPFIERLITMSKRAALVIGGVNDIPDRQSPEWSDWRGSDRWTNWVDSVSPALSLRRRAFALLRNDAAVSILFRTLASRFKSRCGGYVRVVRVTTRRVGDSGQVAFIEFVGELDRRNRPIGI